MFFRILLSFVCVLLSAVAQGESVFKGVFCNDDTGFRLHLDLDEETVEIPGMSFLGLTHGYLDGKTNNHVYGVWMLVSHQTHGNQVRLRFSNDIGSDSQDVLLTALNDSTFRYEATGGNCIRKVAGRKLEKTPSTMMLYRRGM